jgi:hypothetical protein
MEQDELKTQTPAKTYSRKGPNSTTKVITAARREIQKQKGEADVH